MAFSGGSYDDVARWLENFLKSHAKRENFRAEVLIDSGDEREGKSYGATLKLDGRDVPAGEFDFTTVAEHKGELAWCTEQAERIRAVVRDTSRSGVRR
jgi:hypothetical protein